MNLTELRRLSEAASDGPYVFNGYPFALAGPDAEFAVAAANFVREFFDTEVGVPVSWVTDSEGYVTAPLDWRGELGNG